MLIPGFWTSRTLWSLAWRAARSGYGFPYFEMHPEFMPWFHKAMEMRK